MIGMKRIAVLTSGGDAQGMNAAVRAVVRCTLDKGLEAYAVYEGYQGMVDGGDRIRPIGWNDVGGVLQYGGTIIGSARCQAFRERPGRLQAARNLILAGIEGLVIIGGDGSLTGAHILQGEWTSLVAELLSAGEISPEQAAHHRSMSIVGLVGSIDNDMFGTDMTIGADTALHRIVDALDMIASTAASHQRSFVVEVMGRRCGYLALMSALASGADWVLIPEHPPEAGWEARMCQAMQRGRQEGRRDSIVVVAEGAQDREGRPISAGYVKQVLEEQLGEDTRVTVLGHVQRGGSPSAFDRNLSTLSGAAAVEEIITGNYHSEPCVIGIQGNKISSTPLSACIEKTQAVATAIAEKRFDQAIAMRGRSFVQAFKNVRTLMKAAPSPAAGEGKRLRIAVMNAGGPAPGMNPAVRALVRLAKDRGHQVLGISHGFKGLIGDDIHEMGWMDVAGWSERGGAELGANRTVPEGKDFYAIAQNLEKHQIEALVMIGGWAGYAAMIGMHQRRDTFGAFDIPMVCVPASINNNLPGAELCIGADTALNNIVGVVDKIKTSAVSSQRTFVVEVMGRYCGYLALMSALATGAERAYIHEEGVTLADLVADVAQLKEGFRRGKRLGLVIRNEMANEVYSTAFMNALFDEEGGDLFDVRQAILGHMQQGGNPSPFDRILATQMVSESIGYLEEQAIADEKVSACIGTIGGDLLFTPLEQLPRMYDERRGRPKSQWWMDLRAIGKVLAQPAPGNSHSETQPGA